MHNTHAAFQASVLEVMHAGEILTLQRAAYVTEAIAHADLDLPPLTQTLEDLRDELDDADVVGLGVWEYGRLLGAVRVRRVRDAVELGRLVVVPDRQGQGIGSFLLHEAEEVHSTVDEIRLFTGEHSLANIRLYERNGYTEIARTPAGSYSLVHLMKHRSPR